MFSDVSLALLALFLALHTYGAHYTYSETPLGDRWRDAFGLARNPYDRFVHFACGLLATYPWRELAMRVLHLRKGGAWWLPLLASLAVSAGYELVESWIARLVAPELGTAFLGTQGDPWDAQKDMGAALAGTFSACTRRTRALAHRTQHNACRGPQARGADLKKGTDCATKPVARSCERAGRDVSTASAGWQAAPRTRTAQQAARSSRRSVAARPRAQLYHRSSRRPPVPGIVSWPPSLREESGSGTTGEPRDRSNTSMTRDAVRAGAQRRARRNPCRRMKPVASACR